MGTNSSSDMSGSHADHTRSASGQYSSSSSSDRSSNKLGWGDKRFVTKAADSGQAEVAIAQLAAQKATNPDVRQFAQQMVDQHTQVNSQLMSIASSKNVKVDQDDTTKDRTYKRLSNASGNDFDREFVEHMVDEHEKDIKLFEKAANNAKDSEIRQFASSTLPHLREHLTQVQQLQRSIVPTGREDDSSGRSTTYQSGSTAGNGTMSTDSSAATSGTSRSDTSAGGASGSSWNSKNTGTSGSSTSGSSSSSSPTTR